MNKNEAHDGGVESGDVAAVRVVTPLVVAALNAVCSVDHFRDLDLRGSKLLRIGLPDGEIAIGKFALECSFDRCKAFVVLDIQGLVETSHIFFAQAIGSPVANATRKARVLDQLGAVVASLRIASKMSCGIC